MHIHLLNKSIPAVIQLLNPWIPSMMFHLCLILLWLPNVVLSNNVNSYKPVESILIRCGSPGNAIVNNRSWTGDVNTTYSPIDTPNGEHSVRAAAPVHYPPVDPNLYGTARLSLSEFTYSFSVTDGQKFIRLHFYPATYLSFNRSNSLFSVKAGPYTLLKDFNASFTADNDERDQNVTVSREYCLNVEPGERLNITFIPSHSHPQAYAFINWIEIVSMPTDLYYTRPFAPEIRVVGREATFFPLGNDIMLEMMYRIDVGSSQAVPPEKDTGMFRTWEPDNNYLKQETSASLPRAASNAELHYTQAAPNYTAPDEVYLTARSYSMDKTSWFNVTWGFQVDAGFNYTVRLHFCEFETDITRAGDRVFQIFIADMMAENYADVILWAGDRLTPIKKDYSVLQFTSGNLKRPNLTIKLQQHPDRRAGNHPDVILNGIEIFKLSSDNNLGGPNFNSGPSPQLTQTSNNSNKGKTVMVATTVCATAFFLILSLVSLSIIVFRRRRRGKGQGSGEGHGSSNPSHLCRYFSLAEIIAATKNFDANFIVGHGGFGNVYKGYINDGTTPVAIKRLRSGSQQGDREFQTEIEMLSQLCHLHLVSLIGFSNENNEMILVYDFMQRGTLRDHLYDADKGPLSWKQRLEILLGAAKGLHFLHTGAKHRIIHRDVKSTNILLDEKWVAKISDFGLSKVLLVGHSGISQSHITTEVKGSIGYLDPEYFKSQQLTKKSDVYSFGVVLLEVLCGRPPILRTVEKQRASLVDWVRKCHDVGEFGQTVDPFLRGSIKPQCLKAFGDMALSCLREDGNQRPSMSDVVEALEFALELQESDEENMLGGMQEEGMDEQRSIQEHDLSQVLTNSKYTATTTTTGPSKRSEQALLNEVVVTGIRNIQEHDKV